MNQSKSLFKLIYSLTPREHKIVVAAIKSHRYSKAYVRMFKEMLKQPSYDENKIKKIVKSEPFIKHFAVIKNHLFQFILRVLRNSPHGNHTIYTSGNLLIDAEFLLQKGLLKESWHKLQQARKIALKIEDWKTLTDILYREFALIPRIRSKDKEGEYNRITTELTDFLMNYANYEAIKKHNVLINCLIEQDMGLGIYLSQIEELIADPLFSREENAITLRAKVLYFSTWTLYYLYKCEYETAMYYTKMLRKLYQRKPYLLEWFPQEYLYACQYLIICHFVLEDFDESSKAISEVKCLIEEASIKNISSQWLSILLFSATFRYELIIASKTKNATQLQDYAKNGESVFWKNYELMDSITRLETLLALAVYYFSLSYRYESMKAVQEVLFDKDGKKYRHYTIIALTIQFIIQVEEGNNEILPYLLKNSAHYIVLNQKVSKTENALLDLWSALYSISRYRRTKSALQTHLESFLSIKQDKQEKQYYQFFDVTLWLENYLRGNVNSQ